MRNYFSYSYFFTCNFTVLILANFSGFCSKGIYFFITEIDVDRLARSRSLEYVDLSDNPIPPRTHEELKQLSRPIVSVSEREKEDWEEDMLI